MRRLGFILTCLLGVVFTLSCRDDNFTPWSVSEETAKSVVNPGRVESEEIRNVVIMVSGGYNSLSSYLRQDLKDLSDNYLTGGYRSAHVLLVLSRLPADGQFSTTSAPVLYRMYREEGELVRDTLKTWPQGTQLFGGSTLRDALQFVYDRFPARGYGMILSSHGSGWLPEEYYFDPSKFEGSSYSGGDVWNVAARRSAAPYFPEIVEDGAPVKSIGQDKDGSAAVEMDLLAFRDALPFHLDYLLLDACLSGGVEVAYELRDKVDVLGFSQAELLAEGFEYETLMSRLLVSDPDPVAACRDAYEFYAAQTGVNNSAAFSTIDLREMEELSDLCRTLFQKYRSALDALQENSGVQGYFRFERHFFYDLKDVLLKAGISPEEEAQLDAALDKCVLFKGATPYFMKGTQYGFAITCHSGFSMYLPAMGTDYLDQYYKANLAWNQATGLVQ